MYKRKIEKTLLDWKSRSNHKPLVIKGCRQCGKTSSVLAFAKANYNHVIYLDFHEHEEYKAFFAGALNPDTIVLNITLGMNDVKFVPGQTCLIFDEIQECSRARSSLKFFSLDGRYDVICTGSLLGVSGYMTPDKTDEGASIPVGFEEIINMYPMDFEEWLWAHGVQQQHFDYLQGCFERQEPVNEAIHQRMRELLLKYVIVGGMPAVVSTFFSSNDMNQVQTVQRNIINAYKDDMLKYASNHDKPLIKECFESIPAQLARENKKFTYSIIRSKARASQYQGSLQWIEDAGIIRRCYNLSITELPLDENAIKDSFKVYMADIGLLVSMLEEGTAWSVMQGNLLSYKGAIFENLIADILGKMGRKLYYFKKNSGLEIDFVMRYKGECCPLECKANSGNSKSLKTILKHPEHYHVTHAIKVGDYNIGKSNSILTLPLYMTFMLTQY